MKINKIYLMDAHVGQVVNGQHQQVRMALVAETELVVTGKVIECVTVEKMQEREKILLNALDKAQTKLIIYRKNTTGEYQGGMEYMALMDLINEAVAEK